MRRSRNQIENTEYRIQETEFRIKHQIVEIYGVQDLSC